MSTPTLKIKVTPTPKIKGKMDVRFPANVSASSPIILDRTGGNFALSFDLNSISGGFATAAQGEKADTALQSIVAGTNVSVDSTDPLNPVVSAIGSGSGDVTGPASAADGTPAVFDGTDGKVLKNVSYATFKSSLSLAKGDVGLGNVDDTSDATKNAAAVTLTNKTLTAPKFVSGGFIADANGNEEIVFTTTASAVNELTIANAATGAAPTITASGGDTNVGMSLVAKGTGNLSFMPITGQVTIGSLTGYAVNAESGTPFTPTFQIHAAGAAATASITRWSANGNQGRFAFAKSRGAAIGTRGIVADGDSLGTFIFNGDDGTNFVTGAVITARISGTPGTNDMPTQLVFSTTPDGASTPTEWVSLGPTGELRVSDLYMLPNTAVPAGGAAGRGLRMSSTANLGIYFGSGLPTLSAAQGSLYIRTDGSSTSTRLYVNTNGTTGWTNLTSAT